MNVLDRYVASPPSGQNIVDLFANEWSSQMPDGSQLKSTPGTATLFNDARIVWLNKVFNSVKDKNVLELGPLEAAHSYMLQKMGVNTVTAIEANTHAFMKCLCVKELFGLDRVTFKLGDFIAYMDSETRRFDMVLACGILYHMMDPMTVLDLLAKMSDNIFIWTHYFDHDVIMKNEALANKFSALQNGTHRGFAYEYSTQSYKQALDWDGFCGGPQATSRWLSRSSILSYLQKLGFSRVSINFDHPFHPNGPAFAICAQHA